MTKRDYELIASVLRAERESHADDLHPEARRAIAKLANKLAWKLASVKPTFDREIFLQECGL